MKVRVMTRLAAIAILLIIAAGLMGCASLGRRGADNISEQELPILAEAIESVVRGEEDISLLYSVGVDIARGPDVIAPDRRDEVPAIMSKLDQGLPRVLNAVRTRQRRYVTIQQYMASGCLGENRKAKVHFRPCPDVDENEHLHDRLAVLIISENGDRWTIYEDIARHSALDGRTLKKVQRIFVDIHRDHALPGTLIQLDSGEWAHKGQ